MVSVSLTLALCCTWQGYNAFPTWLPRTQANLGLFAVQLDHYYFLSVYILSSHL